MMETGTNVDVYIDEAEQELVIKCKMTAQGQLSGSGRNFTIATTHGYQQVAQVAGKAIKLNLNLIRKK